MNNKDLCAINDNSLFEKDIIKIYSEKLNLKRENVSSTQASFLYIDLKEIKGNEISTKSYNKWDSLSHLKLFLCLSLIAIPPLLFFH